ncbi:MAG: glucosamine-6-phosphate deaminase [Acidobacteria bacterium]|jgi:glucosamine-6-phosphate deaminase|nr:glucosamine-6-phosphate deaminase [Acidobacteriota bacterium]
MGKQAAEYAAGLIRQAIRDHGRARLIFSAANSQLPMLDVLVGLPEIDWGRVEAFHVDEYFGMAKTHPQSFAGWLKRNLVDRVHPGKAHYLAGDAPDMAAECRRYADLLAAAPIDISFLGFGENGHIGFNDPHEANFQDPYPVRTVTLDERCRLQQVNEGHWPGLSAVPDIGLTLTCPTLVHASYIVCCVPGQSKAEAVQKALEGPVTSACPGSLLQTHPRAHVYLDQESAALLSKAATKISVSQE